MTDLTDIPIIATRKDGYRIVANVHDLPADTPCWSVWVLPSTLPCPPMKLTTRASAPDPCPVLIAPAAPATERVPWWEALGRTLPDRRIITQVADDVEGGPFVRCGSDTRACTQTVFPPIDDNGTVEVLTDPPADDIVWVPLTRADAEWRVSTGLTSRAAGTMPERGERLTDSIAAALARNPKRGES